jgi:hypothetical protein
MLCPSGGPLDPKKEVYYYNLDTPTVDPKFVNKFSGERESLGVFFLGYFYRMYFSNTGPIISVGYPLNEVFNTTRGPVTQDGRTPSLLLL